MYVLSLANPAHNRRATVDDASRQRRCSRRHAACWQRSTTARLPLSYCTPSARLRRLRRVARGGKAADEPAGKAANRTHLARRRGGARFTCRRRGAHAALCALRATLLAKVLLCGLRFAAACAAQVRGSRPLLRCSQVKVRSSKCRKSGRSSMVSASQSAQDQLDVSNFDVVRIRAVNAVALPSAEVVCGRVPRRCQAM